MDLSSIPLVDAAPVTEISALVHSPEATRVAVAALHRHRGTGKDGIPAELLQAGKSAVAVKLYDLHRRVINEEQWPLDWSGGRIVDVHKRKGSKHDCDCSRGILLANHSGKALCRLLADHLRPTYDQHMPKDQYGAVSCLSTDLATHIVRSFFDYSLAAALSVFVLFVDLVKAFDRAIREIVFGFPRGVTNSFEYLRGLGLSEEQAAWLLEYLATYGSLFEQWGVDQKVIALIRNLHANSWFAYGSLDTAIVVRVGGRQGCKLGAIALNSAYGVGLGIFHAEMLDAGIELQLRPSGTDFWGPSQACHGCTENSIDSILVDDECVLLSGKSSSVLDC